MYDIQTLFAVPEGLGSKAIASTLRAFSDKTNAMPLRRSATAPVKAAGNPPPRFPSRKASATVALTSTTASRTGKPHSPALMDPSQRSENVIPFPTASAEEHTTAHDPPPGLKRPLPAETRRRRSGALMPPTGRPSSATVVARPVAKRPRKSKRVLADLQFTATVHRSIIALHLETDGERSCTTEADLDVMNVDNDSGEGEGEGGMLARVREELRGLDHQLVARLAQRLRTGGFASMLIDAGPTKEDSKLLPSLIPLEGTRAPPPSPETDNMDVMLDSPPASPAASIASRRLPSTPTTPPPPSVDLAAPRTPPGLVSPRVPPPLPAEKRIYTMPQLVATHILRLRERGSVKPPGPSPRTLRTRSPLNRSFTR
ncbi:hypothetical protein BC834DRAFT_427168 [Gloeopeniophorella convolvens]|nr:hypothetical protein BC834DRAFT_427168 [Gloeopeniophorella convolvens]